MEVRLDENGKCTITGTAIYPVFDQNSSIKSVDIDVTFDTMSEFLFYCCSNLVSVKMQQYFENFRLLIFRLQQFK